jgi:hypothetical protein
MFSTKSVIKPTQMVGDRVIFVNQAGLFGICRGKQAFYHLVLEHYKAMHQSGVAVEQQKNEGELFCPS